MASDGIVYIADRGNNRVRKLTPPLSDDATLSTLALTGIDVGVFTGEVMAYTATVGHAVATTTVTATPTHAAATVIITDAAGSTTGTSRTVTLDVGVTTVSLTVAAEDGQTTQTYTISVTRAPATILGLELPIPGPAHESPVAVWSATLTVGADTSVVPMTSGYSVWGAALGGTLSTATFTIDDVAYRVLFILHHAGGVYLGMTGEIPTDFVLHIGEAAFAARESSVPNTRAAAAYWWADQTFTWTPGETIHVSITPVVPVSITPVHDLDEALPERQASPPTAFFKLVPEHHNGVDAFTFRTYFSEEIAMSYKTLRDGAFTVTGGTVKKAKRITKGSNRQWNITVVPDADADVTVALPATTDCNATGAICTADGRRLSNRVEVVVAGPAPQSLRKAVRRGSGAGQVVDDGYTLVFPVSAQTSTVRTALALHNPEAATLVVQCVFQTADSVLADAALTLAAHRQATGFVNEWFPEMPEVEGSVRCTAGAEFTGVAVEMDTGSGFFSSVFEEADASR